MPPTTSTNSPYSPHPTPQGKNNNQQNIHDFIRNHKTLSSVVLFSGILIIAAIIIILITPKKPVETVPEIAPIPYYEHRYLLDYTVNRSLVDDLFTNLSDDILSQEEIDSAPKENPTSNTYTISLDEESFTLLKQQPQYTYKVDFLLSDDRTYTLYLRIDQDYGQEYMVAVLDRTDSPSSVDHIYIYINPDTEEKEKEKLTTSLTNWAKTLAPNDPTVETFNLVVPEK